MAMGLPRVEHIYAWICTDDADNTEAIPAFTTPNGVPMPMVAIRREIAEMMRPKAEQFVANGKKMALVEFASRITLEEIDPTTMPVDLNE